MPLFNVETPDGTVVKVDAPEGATQQQAIAYVASTWKPTVASSADDTFSQDKAPVQSYNNSVSTDQNGLVVPSGLNTVVDRQIAALKNPNDTTDNATALSQRLASNPTSPTLASAKELAANNPASPENRERVAADNSTIFNDIQPTATSSPSVLDGAKILGGGFSTGVMEGGAMLNRAIGYVAAAPAPVVDMLHSIISGPTDSATDWAKKNFINPNTSAIDYWKPTPDQADSVAYSLAHGLGSLAEQLPFMGAAGEASGIAVKVTDTALSGIASTIKQGMATMSPMSFSSAVNLAAENTSKGIDPLTAIKSAVADFGSTSLMGAVPIGGSGGRILSAVKGSVNMAALTSAGTEIQNIATSAYPEQYQNPLDTKAIGMSLLNGALFGATVGHIKTPEQIEANTQKNIETAPNVEAAIKATKDGLTANDTALAAQSTRSVADILRDFQINKPEVNNGTETVGTNGTDVIPEGEGSGNNNAAGIVPDGVRNAAGELHDASEHNTADDRRPDGQGKAVAGTDTGLQHDSDMENGAQLKVQEASADSKLERRAGNGNRDALYNRAVDAVTNEGRASVSLIQRNTGMVPWARAERILDQMVQNGIVSHDIDVNTGFHNVIGGNENAVQKSEAGAMGEQPNRNSSDGRTEGTGIQRSQQGHEAAGQEAADESNRTARVSDFTPEKVKGILSKNDWTILTAENPHAEKLPPEENAQRMTELKSELDKRGLTYTEVKGKYGGNDENSLLITGISREDASKIGQQFGQESVLTRNGLIYDDGTMQPAVGVTNHTGAAEQPDDNYSRIPSTGAHFTVDMDWDNRVPAPKVGETQLVGTHYPNSVGSIKGAEWKRIQSGEDRRLDSRKNYYVDEGNGVQPEPGINGKSQQEKVGNLYDAAKNPLHFPSGIGKENDFESAVLDHGYSGYYVRGAMAKQGRAVLLGDAAKRGGDITKSESERSLTGEESEYAKQRAHPDNVKFTNKEDALNQLTPGMRKSAERMIERANQGKRGGLTFGTEQENLQRAAEMMARKNGTSVDTERAKLNDAMQNSITPEQAMATNVKLNLPTDGTFVDAVSNTKGAKITPDGLLIDTVRFQKQEQEGANSVRTGVFYLPQGDANVRYYRKSTTGYGGTERFADTTLLRAPLFVKGATGGKAPEAAYDQIVGKNAYNKMSGDVLRQSVLPGGYWNNKLTKQDKIDSIANLLKWYGSDPSAAADILHNSTEGNTLRYAIQENIVAHAVREAGYDSVLGYSKKKSGDPFISEIFDVRETTYPSKWNESDVHQKFIGSGIAKSVGESARDHYDENYGKELDREDDTYGKPLTELPSDHKSGWDISKTDGTHVYYSKDSKVNAFYHPDIGNTFVNTDRISARDAPGVILHEVAHAANNDNLNAEVMRRLNVVPRSSFDNDMARQEATMERVARIRGFKSIDEWLAKEPAEFNHVAENWRDHHPLFDKSVSSEYSKNIGENHVKENTGAAFKSGVADNKNLLSTVAGKPAAEGWAGATRATRNGTPAVFYRGAERNLEAGHFERGSLGFASKNPSSGLGVFLTSHGEEAATYHPNVQKFYLDTRNPKIIKMDELPAFDSVEDAHAYREKLIAQGYDSLVLTGKHLGKNELHVVAFSPEQVIHEKSATTISKSVSAEPFYSQLAKAVGAAPDKVFSNGNLTSSWLNANAAKLGIKKAEIEATGIDDWLKLQGKVSKADVQNFLEQNGVQVKEVTLGEPVAMDKNDARRFGATSTAASGTTKFASYQLPGGENYKELLLTLPEKQNSNTARVQQLKAERDDMLLKALESDDNTDDTQRQIRNIETQMRLAEKEGKEKTFNSSHYDQPNILAHIRFNERTDAEGHKVLFLEELQSDFGQTAKKKGIAGEPLTKSEQAEYDTLIQEGRRNLPENEAARLTELSDKKTRSENGVPNAPFIGDTKAWTALALKRMIRYAAENNFDKVAWTTGEQQAARYDLSKQISQVQFDLPYEATHGHLYAFDHAGNRVIGKTIKPSELADHIGKDVAEKLMKQTPENGGMRTLKGVDLKVGGEGMKGYYDQIVPQVANDILKKLGGGKVEKYILKRVTTEPLVQQGITITPELRAKVMNEGLPLFSKRGAAQGDIYARVKARMDAAGETGNAKEATSYLVEEAMNMGRTAGHSRMDTAFWTWATKALPESVVNTLRQWVSAVRAAMFRNGIALKEKDLTIDDFVAIAKANMKDLASGKLDAAGGQEPITGSMQSKANNTKLRNRPYSKDEMIARGAGGALSSGYERYIPIEKLDGLEPSPTNNESDDGLYHAGRTVSQPIETVYDSATDKYIVMAGNHRIEQAKANGQSHIAAFVEPDSTTKSIGKDALLSEPTKQTDTPAFKRWFGDSKVVDAEGKPLVVYHGTKGDIKTFDSKRIGTGSTIFGDYDVERHGIFVTPVKDLANDFATQGERHKQEGANMMPLFASIKNPIDMTEGYTDKIFNAVEKWGNEKGLDGYRVARNLGDNWGDWEIFDKDGGQDPEFTIGMLKDIGYDGVKFHEGKVAGEGASGDTYVAFDPDQIKSAIGNRGTFDPANPDIRMSRSEIPKEGTSEPQKEKTEVAGRLDSVKQRVSDVVDKIVNEVQMAVAPMAAGKTKAADEFRATAKDFANNERNARQMYQNFDKTLVEHYTPDELEKMWNAADEQGVLMQEGKSTTGKGLDRLTPEQRDTMNLLHSYGEDLLQKAKDVGMFKGEGLPYWTPRMAAIIGDDGEYARVPAKTGIGGINEGRNVTTNAQNLKQRKYLTAEETEAAMKAKFGDNATLVRNLRTMPMAMARLEQAVAGRALVNKIRELGSRIGEDLIASGEKVGFSQINHPAFTTFSPDFIEVDGKMVPRTDQNGDMVFKKTPLYVRDDIMGPLKSIMSTSNSAVYNGLMALKGKTMSVIMYSPLIHNAVEFGRALPMLPGKVFTLQVYFEGNKAKNDPAQMRQAIDDGMVPIGHHGGVQDITGITENAELKAGRSLTAKAIGGAVGLVNKNAGEAVKHGIDVAGNVWHNTMLWDRIGDLQMGIYTNVKRIETAKLLNQGLSQAQADGTAGKIAGHMANRYAGALPNEAMSAMSRKIANLTLFSRSFTLGNVGVMKDIFTGLPLDVKAQIKRDYGDLALRAGTDIARRKAIGAFIVDVGLMYAANSIMQDVFDKLKRNQTLSDVEKGYVDRFNSLMHHVKENPLGTMNSPLDSLESLTSTAANEPGKENRILYGYDKNGTGIYVRMPTGKIGEEFIGWSTSPLDMLKRKESTFLRPIIQTATNDLGLGRRVYNPDDPGVAGAVRNVGKIVKNFMVQQIPNEAIQSAINSAKGEGNEMDAYKIMGPLLGLTFSKGAPGGPAMGEIYKADKERRAAIADIMPDVRGLIVRGHQDEAVQKMIGAGMSSAEIRLTLEHALNPQSRLNSGAINKFYKNSSDEQKEKMNQLLNR